ncbi:pyrroline-5-carboxylate reductase [Helicobacter sp. 11S02596-1]|uniref:pyrroline-5-carboxylate reductase n=1 Tax=Helicobacter sp. 11S02596-1 TaxID=1476194 RepID=UPI000BA55164|nr:pyrroline-5-carboxylate reductase [Helicobacter sp. 11S02596-1]PAF44850.1 pyrroline-5-carboxylate reductase [Helicobacter sp. 11S02596-1]
MSVKKTLLFVGYGSMAKAIALGIASSDLKNKYHIEITGRDTQKAQKFIEENHLGDVATIHPPFMHEISSQSSLHGSSGRLDVDGKIVILCVKPYALGSFVYFGKAHSVYSVLAGVGMEMLKQHIQATNYAKIMPNVGARFQKSSTAVYIEGDIQEEAREIISSFGCAVFVDSESLVDASIATGGSSPAFLALIAQALIDAGVREGLKRDDALKLVRATFEGFANLLAEQSPDTIIAAITSPGGTTIEGLSVLEDRAVRGAVIEACHRAVAKSRQKH